MTEETGKTGAAGRKGLLDRLEMAGACPCRREPRGRCRGAGLAGLCALCAQRLSPSWTEPLALVLIANTAMLGAAIGDTARNAFRLSAAGGFGPGADPDSVPGARAARHDRPRSGALGVRSDPDGGCLDRAYGRRRRCLWDCASLPVALGGALIAVFAHRAAAGWLSRAGVCACGGGGGDGIDGAWRALRRIRRLAADRHAGCGGARGFDTGCGAGSWPAGNRAGPADDVEPLVRVAAGDSAVHLRRRADAARRDFRADHRAGGGAGRAHPRRDWGR